MGGGFWRQIYVWNIGGETNLLVVRLVGVLMSLISRKKGGGVGGVGVGGRWLGGLERRTHCNTWKRKVHVVNTVQYSTVISCGCRFTYLEVRID
jgi:hypothetical protein